MKTKEKNREPDRDQTRKTRDDKPRDRDRDRYRNDHRERDRDRRSDRDRTRDKAVTDREALKHQKKNGKIGVKTKEAMTMGHKKQANKDSEVLAVLLHNKIILFPFNLHAQLSGA